MKNTNKQSVELSYYRLTLQSFLLESHPELAANAEFIAARGDLAAETYSQVIKDGYTPSQAEEFANEVLYKDLNFSKHDTLVNILWNEFADEVPQGSAKKLARQLLPVCEVIFAKYSLTDDFAYELQFDQLYTELTGTIVLWLEDHELQ
ncbi:MAG: DUF1896 domain-containing protein [Paludibacter sp.]|nr:DUF1896 domain-containing protein [Paludibacter sp.]